jgi:hypothetical protein
MGNYDITLRWSYSSGRDYEFHSKDAAQVGQLYRLKVLEDEVECVDVLLGDFVVIEWKRQKE